MFRRLMLSTGERKFSLDSFQQLVDPSVQTLPRNSGDNRFDDVFVVCLLYLERKTMMDYFEWEILMGKSDVISGIIITKTRSI